MQYRLKLTKFVLFCTLGSQRGCMLRRLASLNRSACNNFSQTDGPHQWYLVRRTTFDIACHSSVLTWRFTWSGDGIGRVTVCHDANLPWNWYCRRCRQLLCWTRCHVHRTNYLLHLVNGLARQSFRYVAGVRVIWLSVADHSIARRHQPYFAFHLLI